MLRFLFGALFCLSLCCTALFADTPGEEAVKDAIKTLKEKRAAVKDKADQALLDTQPLINGTAGATFVRQRLAEIRATQTQSLGVG